MGKEPSTKADPQIVVLDKSFLLMDEWVSKTSPSGVEENSKEPEPVRLPPRSGLGVKPSKHVEVGVSADPIQRGLLKKLAYVKNKSKSEVESDKPKGGECSDEDEDEDESRAKVFSKMKKRGVPDFTFPLKKKQKQKQK